MDQLSEITQKISQLVSDAPDGTLLGVRLGTFIKQSFPDFYPTFYGNRNLRQFIRTRVPEITEKGRSGTDVLYGIKRAVTTAPPLPIDKESIAQTSLPINSFYWKAYSNPAQHSILVSNRETGEFTTHLEGLNVQPPWVVIPKPTPGFHLGIAKEFADTRNEPARSALLQELKNPKWYVRFSQIAYRCGEGTNWSNFRRAKLIDTFNSSVMQLEIPQNKAQNKESPAESGISNQPLRPESNSATATNSDESAIRDLICKVVLELPLSDLRSIRLPVGAILDALKQL